MELFLELVKMLKKCVLASLSRAAPRECIEELGHTRRTACPIAKRLPSGEMTLCHAREGRHLWVHCKAMDRKATYRPGGPDIPPINRLCPPSLIGTSD